MWIKNRKKDHLANIVSVKKYKQFKTFYLIGKLKSQNIATSDIVLGKFNSEDEVDRELKAIEEAIINSERIYSIK